MREAGVGLAGPPFARYLAFEPRIRAEIGFPVQRPAPHVGRVFPGRLPGGRVASIVHIGPFDGLERTYGLMHRWLAEMGLAPNGPIWEVYWSDPRRSPTGEVAHGDLRPARVAPGASTEEGGEAKTRGGVRGASSAAAPHQPRATRTPSVRRCA